MYKAINERYYKPYLTNFILIYRLQEDCRTIPQVDALLRRMLLLRNIYARFVRKYLLHNNNSSTTSHLIHQVSTGLLKIFKDICPPQERIFEKQIKIESSAIYRSFRLKCASDRVRVFSRVNN